MSSKVAVLGAGSWGSALANVLVENGHQVNIWTREEKQKNEINTNHTNEHYLPEFKFPDELVATTDLKQAVMNAEAILVVIPTNGIRQLARKLNDTLDRKVTIIHASKGLERETHKRISVILNE